MVICNIRLYYIFCTFWFKTCMYRYIFYVYYIYRLEVLNRFVFWTSDARPPVVYKKNNAVDFIRVLG